MYLLQTCIKSTGKKWVKIVTEYINTQSTPETSRNIDFSLYRWAVIVNCWFCCTVWTYDLLYIMSSFVSQEALFVRQFIVCRWKICWLLPIVKFVARRRLSEAILSLVWHGPEVLELNSCVHASTGQLIHIALLQCTSFRTFAHVLSHSKRKNYFPHCITQPPSSWSSLVVVDKVSKCPFDAADSTIRPVIANVTWRPKIAACHTMHLPLLQQVDILLVRSVANDTYSLGGLVDSSYPSGIKKYFLRKNTANWAM